MEATKLSVCSQSLSKPARADPVDAGKRPLDAVQKRETNTAGQEPDTAGQGPDTTGTDGPWVVKSGRGSLVSVVCMGVDDTALWVAEERASNGKLGASGHAFGRDARRGT